MTFDEAIKYCDGLDFLNRIEKPFNRDKLIASKGLREFKVVYSFNPIEDFNLCLHRGGAACFAAHSADGFIVYYRDSSKPFEDCFEKLSQVAKDNIIYHLDLFNKVLL